MEYKIVTIPGDGIEPEIVREACKVLIRWAVFMVISLHIRKY